MTVPSPKRTATQAATCVEAAPGYREKRSLRRYAGVWSLWALGVGAVISGHFSGWNLGLAVGICLVTLVCQVQDPLFLQGSVWVVVWLGLAIAYYALVARHRLVLTPDETAARSTAQATTRRGTA